MADRSPFTIEIVQFGDDHGPSVVLDRVIGGSVHFDEAKRIGHHLLSIAETGTKLVNFASSATMAKSGIVGLLGE